MEVEVRIKHWKTMEKEYGLNPRDKYCIACENDFVDCMKYMCGKLIKIKKDNILTHKIVDSKEGWAISKDMIYKKYHKEFERLLDESK